MSDTQSNKAIVQRIYADGWNKGNEAAIDEILASDLKHEPFFPDWPTGAASFKRLVRLWRTAFPDLHEEVVEMIAEGDQVASRIRISGTHRGEFYGLGGAGRSFSIYGGEMFRLRDGKVVEYAYSEDVLGLFTQLGAMPVNHPAFAAR